MRLHLCLSANCSFPHLLPCLLPPLLCVRAVRSLTTDSVAFCKAMQDSSVSSEDRYSALKKAVQTHGGNVKESVMGMGIDRHLLGMQIAAEVSGGIIRDSLERLDCSASHYWTQ